jgi:hypothetical protein
MLRELVLQCTSGVGSNPLEQNKILSVQNLSLTLGLNVPTIIQKYLIQPGILQEGRYIVCLPHA